MDIDELDARTKKFLLQFCRDGFRWGEEGNVPDLFKVLAELDYIKCSWKNLQMIFYPCEKLCQACYAWDEAALDHEIAYDESEIERRFQNLTTDFDSELI